MDQEQQIKLVTDHVYVALQGEQGTLLSFREVVDLVVRVLFKLGMVKGLK